MPDDPEYDLEYDWEYDETTDPGVETLLSALAREISRVTAVRAEYERVQAEGPSNVDCRFAIAIMSRSIEAAIKAAGSGDTMTQAQALQDLGGYNSE